MQTEHQHIKRVLIARNVNGDKFLDCAPFILGIPRLHSAFYRMRSFLECVEHIHVYKYYSITGYLCKHVYAIM